MKPLNRQVPLGAAALAAYFPLCISAWATHNKFTYYADGSSTAEFDSEISPGWTYKSFPDGSVERQNVARKITKKSYVDGVQVTHGQLPKTTGYAKQMQILLTPNGDQTWLEARANELQDLEFFGGTICFVQINPDGSKFLAHEWYFAGSPRIMGQIQKVDGTTSLSDFKLVKFRDGIISTLEPIL
jgi:hypothetical protein